MPHDDADLASKIIGWITRREREDDRLEFKLRIDLTTPGNKAELIRDVIALSNSSEEHDGRDAYLIIGYSDGEFSDGASDLYDGAVFGQILREYISPPIQASYKRFSNGSGGSVGALIIRQDPSALHLVKKKLKVSEKVLLSPGQSWARDVSGKRPLSGDDICARLATITQRAVESAIEPLNRRIATLEKDHGPSLDVRRIRFRIEATSNWAEIEELVSSLNPYAREFGRGERIEVLYATSDVIDRVMKASISGGPIGGPGAILHSVELVLVEAMHLPWGGRLREPILDQEDRQLLATIEAQVFSLTWDACRYVRDFEALKVGADLYWRLIRFAAVNELRDLLAAWIKNARRCQEKCNELRYGKEFLEGKHYLNQQVRHALAQDRN